MNSKELRNLRLIAIFTVAIAAILGATGQWASAVGVLGALLLFSAFVFWRGRRFGSPETEPKEGEARTRRIISRVLPALLVLFVAFAVYDIVDDDWFGAGYAGICFGAALVGLYLNRRRLGELELRRKA